MKKLTVVHAKVGEEVEIKTIEHTIEEMHKLVGGWIEVVNLQNGILMVVNEEGAITDLPLNFVTVVIDRGVVKPVHEIFGDVFFVSQVGEDFVSLDKEQIQQVKQMFAHNRKYCIVNSR
jgi:Domain of unknown function (DUF3846)